MKKVLSISLLIIGAACYGFSIYIDDQVLQGQTQIKDAQKKVKQVDSLLSVSPYTKPVGEGIKEAAKGQIAKGQKEIAYYTDLSSNLKTGGMVTIILGSIMALFAFRKKKS